jgi:hypothetical protein
MKSHFPHSVEYELFTHCVLPVLESPPSPLSNRATSCTLPTILINNATPTNNASPESIETNNNKQKCPLPAETEAIPIPTEPPSEPATFIRVTGGSQLMLQATIVMLDNRTEHTAVALVDSGCEGSCIDVKYVRDNNLHTTKLG